MPKSTKSLLSLNVLLLIVVLVVVVYFIVRQFKKSDREPYDGYGTSTGPYQVLGGAPPGSNLWLSSPAYRINQGGFRGEFSNECMQNPGYRMCSLTDGTPGVCGTSGMCLPDMMNEIVPLAGPPNSARGQILPDCYEPLFKESCPRYCNCLGLTSEIDKSSCMNECVGWFMPTQAAL